MRYPASEKLEIIRLVEQSHLPVRRTLEKLGIQPARFYLAKVSFITSWPPRPRFAELVGKVAIVPVRFLAGLADTGPDGFAPHLLIADCEGSHGGL